MESWVNIEALDFDEEMERSDAKTIDFGYINDAKLPRVIEGKVEDLDVWLGSNIPLVKKELREHGAVLFRGYNLATKERFEAVASMLCDKLIANYADLPEEKGTDVVYGSTPYPNTRTIYYHNESSHLSQWPLTQFFACVKASDKGGETPIVDCRKLFKQLPDSFRKKWLAHGFLYVRNFVANFDVSWQQFFKTEDKRLVESACMRENMTFEWGENNSLRVAKHVKAVSEHPETQERTFFNQVQLHHPYFLDQIERDYLVQLFGENGLPRNVMFGDGSAISDDDMKKILSLYEENCVKFAWQNGDLLVVDNMSVAHARLPFEGSRKIIVAMGDVQHESR